MSKKSSKKPSSEARSKGSLTQGTLNINARDSDSAFVNQSNGGLDIHIQGFRDRNGALHGDEVLVCHKDRQEWTVLHHRIREYLETEGDPNYRLLLKGAKTSDGKNFNFQSSDDEGNSLEEPKATKPPSKNRKNKRNKKVSKAICDAVFSDKPWGVTPVLNDKEWKIDDLPRPKRNTAIGGRNISILSIENNLPTTTTPEPEEKKPIEILTPEALDSALPDPEFGIKLPDNIPMVTTTAKPSLISSNSSTKPACSIISLDSLKKEVSNIKTVEIANSSNEHKESSGIENHDTEEEEVPQNITASKKQKRRRKRNPKNNKASLKPSKVIKLPENILFHISSVINHKHFSNFTQKTAYVIKILQRNHSRIAVGHLKPFAIKNSEFLHFSPQDSRVPRMKIPIGQAPSDFAQNPSLYASTLFIAKIKEWDSSKYAFGSLVESIGESSSIQAQTKGFLISNQVNDAPFTEEVLSCLPQLPFTIPKEEYEKRRDLTKDCVFTIDPLTARDLDDALSIEPLGNERYKVGVHIADVSYFVPKDTELDESAIERATSVYLTDHVVPMLPRELCEDLCSLNPGVPRLTFSVEWIMNEKGEVESTWFGRSIIKSAIKLAYEHAQDMLNSPGKEWTSKELPPLSSPWTYSDISAKVGYLQRIALNLRSKRRENGSLRLDIPKVCFSLNKETGLPMGFYLYEHLHSNKLIEEFMLLANISVATKINMHFPQLALLRRHPPPKAPLMAKVANTLKSHCISLDLTDSKTIADSLEQYAQKKDPSSVKKYQVLVTLLTKPMELARYFCTGSASNPASYRHFALNVPLYTHFTSPIRRYPDIIVHRLLDAIVKKESLDWNHEDIHKIATHCNQKRLNARSVSQSSQMLFLTQFICDCGPVENLDAVVLEVKDYSIEILIVDMAWTHRVYLNYMDALSSYEYSSSKGIQSMTLTWKPDVDNKSTGISVLTAFSEVKCTMKKQEGSDKINAVLLRPSVGKK